MDNQPLNPRQPPDEAWWERELHRSEKLVDKFIASLSDAEENAEDAEMADDTEIEEFEELAIEDVEVIESDDEDGESDDDEESDEDLEKSENFPVIHEQALDFGVRVMQLENLPEDASVLFLSAGKVAANLAGGHGLGYENETLCGNIVKCRWALSDCEFCGQMLEYFDRRGSQPALPELIAECKVLSAAIRVRIEKLRKRVWWQGNRL